MDDELALFQSVPPFDGKYSAGHVVVTLCLGQERTVGGRNLPVLFSKEDGTLWQDEQHKSPASSSHLDSSVNLFGII